jgi:hypothetical protein
MILWADCGLNDMTETPAATAEAAVPRPRGYDPFPSVVHNPDRRYCADKTLWDIYKASLLLQAAQERARCSEILKEYLNVAPLEVRKDIFALIGRIESPLFGHR